MGIYDIHILQPDPDDPALRGQMYAVRAHQMYLIKAHRRGEHPYGFMRRDCPMCQVEQS